MFSPDIQDVIVSYVSNLKELLSWRHICHNTFNEFTVYFHCKKIYPFIRPTNVTITDTNLNAMCKQANTITKLIVDNYLFNSNHLIKFKNLTSLRIESCDIRNMVKSSFCNIGDLTELYIDHCLPNVDHSVVKYFPNLKHLSIFKYHPTNDTSVEYVKKLTKLESLEIHEDFNKNISNIEPLVNLKRLVFRVAGHGIPSNIVAMLPKLEVLYCFRYEYTDGDIKHLIHLKELHCGIGCFFSDNVFTNLINLRVLKLNDAVMKIDPNTLSNLINLEELGCGKLQIPDIVFKNFKKLRHIECDENCMMTNRGLKYLPSLTYLSCNNNTNFTDVGLKYLHNLTYLSCGKNKKITDKGLYHLTRLITLKCGYNDNITEKPLFNMYRLKNLSYCTGSNISTNKLCKINKDLSVVYASDPRMV